jgi:hypothetical protein
VSAHPETLISIKRVAAARPFIAAAMKGGGYLNDGIRAALAAADAAAWRLIETAPKDGTEVLVFGRPISGERGSIWVEHYEVVQAGGEAGWPMSVTHWMPLPAPPGKKAA